MLKTWFGLISRHRIPVGIRGWDLGAIVGATGNTIEIPQPLIPPATQAIVCVPDPNSK